MTRGNRVLVGLLIVLLVVLGIEAMFWGEIHGQEKFFQRLREVRRPIDQKYEGLQTDEDPFSIMQKPGIFVFG